MSTIGISLYLDYYSLQQCKEMIDRAASYGYKDIFTSFNFEEYFFPGQRNTSADDKKELFKYAKEKGMSFHVDITKNLLLKVGGNVNDLSYFKDMNIPYIRLDGGFSEKEIAEMTNNNLGIMIEDNLSNYQMAENNLDEVVKSGNPKQFCGCLNFFPRYYTGLNLDEAVATALKFKKHGCATGAFIGSLYSPTEMNNTSVGTPSFEVHRYLPSYIQMTELLCTKAFDFILFGDSNPSVKEIEEVAHAYNCFNNGYIEIPCYFEKLDDEVLDKIKSLTYLSRVDHSSDVIRCCEARGIVTEPYNTININKYSITMDNCLSNQYTGEIQIALTDLAPQKFINVIGQVKPYAVRLLPYIHLNEIKFKLV